VSNYEDNEDLRHVRSLGVAIPGGRQIHATQRVNGEWKQDTYLYRDGNLFYFEQYDTNGAHILMLLSPQEMREFVEKVMPFLDPPRPSGGATENS